MKLMVLTKSPCFIRVIPRKEGILHVLLACQAQKRTAIPRKVGKAVKLRALLACQAQNRTAIPNKSGDGGHMLSLTATAAAMWSVIREQWCEDNLEVRKEDIGLGDKLGECLVV
jgi:hypothetical protein